MIVTILESMNYRPTTQAVIKAVFREEGIVEKLNQIIEWDKVEHKYKNGETNKKVTEKLVPGCCIEYKGNIIGVTKENCLHLVTTPSGPRFLDRFIGEYVMPEYNIRFALTPPHKSTWEAVGESMFGEGTSFCGFLPSSKFSADHALFRRYTADTDAPNVKVGVILHSGSIPVELVLGEKGLYYDSSLFDEGDEEYLLDIAQLAIQCCIRRLEEQKEGGK